MYGLVLYEPFEARVEATWRGLEALARPSYFLTWGWIENWLANLPPDERPQLAVLHEHDRPVAAWFLGRRQLRRHAVVRSWALYVNATGEARHDELGLEHNALLRVPGSRASLETVIAHLPAPWDELFLPAVDHTAFPELGRLGHTHHVRIDREAVAPYVDLDTVRAAGGDYLSLLPAATRALIRRGRRELGELTVDTAVSVRAAHAIFDELLRLDAQADERRSTGPWLERLHRRLIDQRQPHGEIQLLRFRAGETTLGCCYNLTAYGRTVFALAGFAGRADLHLEPGLLCQAAAIEHNLAIGERRCDLLVGDLRDRQHLATDEARLRWIRVQRPRARFSLEDRVRRLRDDLASWRARWFDPLPAGA